jgi:hypothetical protein
MLNRLINYFYSVPSKPEVQSFQPHPSWLLLNQLKVELETRDEWDNTPLLQAIAAFNVHEMQRLINLGANIEARGNNGFTPLAAAAVSGFSDGVRLLLECRADIEAMAINRRRPLAWAVHEGHVEVAVILLLAGANPMAMDDLGDTPTTLAMNSGLPSMMIHFQPPQSMFVEQPVLHEPPVPSGVELMETDDEDEDSLWMDPVTFEQLEDPVTVPSGYTFSRQTLVEWFKEKHNPESIPCPITRIPIPIEALTWGAARLVCEARDRDRQLVAAKRPAEASPMVSPRDQALTTSQVRHKRMRLFDTAPVVQKDAEELRVRLAASARM